MSDNKQSKILAKMFEDIHNGKDIDIFSKIEDLMEDMHGITTEEVIKEEED